MNWWTRHAAAAALSIFQQMNKVSCLLGDVVPVDLAWLSWDPGQAGSGELTGASAWSSLQMAWRQGCFGMSDSCEQTATADDPLHSKIVSSFSISAIAHSKMLNDVSVPAVNKSYDRKIKLWSQKESLEVRRGQPLPIRVLWIGHHHVEEAGLPLAMVLGCGALLDHLRYQHTKLLVQLLPPSLPDPLQVHPRDGWHEIPDIEEPGQVSSSATILATTTGSARLLASQMARRCDGPRSKRV